MAKFSNFSYAASDVWAAAAAATRINNGYEKNAVYAYNSDTRESTLVRQANKIMVAEMMKNGMGWTEEDRTIGLAAQQYWQANLLKIISGIANSFEITAIAVANKEEITSMLDLAILSSLVASAHRGQAREAVNAVKSQAKSQFQGCIKETIQITNAEVLSSHYAMTIGRYRNEIRAGNNLFYWWGEKLTVGSKINCRGRVKAHIHDYDTKAEMTQLHYVKVS